MEADTSACFSYSGVWGTWLTSLRSALYHPPHSAGRGRQDRPQDSQVLLHSCKNSPAVCQNRERAELWVTMSEVPSLPTNIAEHPELRWRQALSWLMIQLQSGARFPCLRRPLRHHPHSACAVPTVCAGGLCSLLPCTAKHGQQLPGCTLQMGEAK